MADPILAKTVLEMFADAILLGKVRKQCDILCRYSVSGRDKMILRDPHPVRIPDLIKLYSSLLFPFAKHLDDTWAGNIM
jgi:hypothetical protein